MATQGKAVRQISLKDFEDQDEKKYGLNGSPTQVERIFPPAANSDREMMRGDGLAIAGNMSTKMIELKLV